MGPCQVVVRLLTGQPDRQGFDRSKTGRRCLRCPTNTVSSSPPTSAIRKSSSTKPIRRLAACRRPNCWAAAIERLVAFSSLSKRSNVPGMRSGFVAGDAAILKKFLLYRTYHGCAMAPPVQTASVAAWNDEAHVLDNRNQYREKFAACTPLIGEVLSTAHAGCQFLPVGKRRPALANQPTPSSPAVCSNTIM
jgi:hypothetical protein